jgi:YHS domain-containing protein
MSRARQMVMIIPCDAHTEKVMAALDAAHIRDWAVVPASQSRRAGHLVYAPPLRERSCDVIFAMGGSREIEQTIDTLKQAVTGQELCAECLVYVWQTRELSLGDVVFDPVCEMSLDRRNALSATHEGVTYYFCAAECRQRFLDDPEAFISK